MQSHVEKCHSKSAWRFLPQRSGQEVFCSPASCCVYLPAGLNVAVKIRIQACEAVSGARAVELAVLAVLVLMGLVLMELVVPME